MTRTAPFAVMLSFLVAGCSETGIGGELPDFPNSSPAPLESVQQTDEIVQVVTPKVDILWTIDNSCSMADEQDKLTESFPFFMDYFLGSGLDYHVAVTSTDIDGTYNGANGTLVSIAGVKYIDLDSPSPIELFESMATLGTTGSGVEKGLGGTYLALETKRDTVNSGYYREEASIHTVVITDEPDYTPNGIVSQNEFVDWYVDLKEDRDERTFNCICLFSRAGIYVDASLQIGGLQLDSTSDDWPVLLDRLGVQAAGLKREYFLSALPVPGTIDVSVRDEGGSQFDFDQAVLDVTTGELIGDWTYESTRNSVTFLEYVPDALSTIVITYDLLAAQQGVGELEATATGTTP